MYRLSIMIFACFAAAVQAENYCAVSHGSPTYDLNYDQVEQQILQIQPKAAVECGVLKSLYKLEDGHTTEGHYKDVVLLIDRDDERFVAVAKSKGLSIFAYTNNLGDEYHFALKGEVARLRPLAPGALAVVEFTDVILPDGFSLYMPVFERVL